MARATPEIKSPEIKSLIPFINDTPGSSGIIEPTINILGVSRIPMWLSKTPTIAMNVDANRLEKAGIELSFIILL